MSNQPIKTLAYEKKVSGRMVTCTIEQFDDDSAYVAGEDIGEMIFEFAPDALELAIKFVSDEGYEPAT